MQYEPDYQDPLADLAPEVVFPSHEERVDGRTTRQGRVRIIAVDPLAIPKARSGERRGGAGDSVDPQQDHLLRYGGSTSLLARAFELQARNSDLLGIGEGALEVLAQPVDAAHGLPLIAALIWAQQPRDGFFGVFFAVLQELLFERVERRNVREAEQLDRRRRRAIAACYPRPHVS